MGSAHTRVVIDARLHGQIILLIGVSFNFVPYCEDSGEVGCDKPNDRGQKSLTLQISLGHTTSLEPFHDRSKRLFGITSELS
jgi:hypothetical protein